MKTGIKTSEFWMVVATAIIIIFNKGLGMDLPEEGILSFFAVISSYVGGRSYLKWKNLGEAIKAGIKTSEFWSVVATALLLVANSGFGLNLPKEAILAVVGVVVTYVVGRSAAKARAA